MSIVKNIEIKPIAARYANLFVQKHHYSHKVVPNSQVHLGAFLGGRLLGVMQFGPSMDKRKIQHLVEGTGWNEFLEFNRMAFSEELPKNSESRCIGIAMRLLKKYAPHVKWVISFADASLCGDGTIYRAANFVLTNIKPNRSTYRMPTGEVVNQMTASAHRATEQGGKAGVAWIKKQGGQLVPGHQLRYIYFIDPLCREKLTVPVVPYSKIAEVGAGMYKGKRRKPKSKAAAFHVAEGGAVPTPAHQ